MSIASKLKDLVIKWGGQPTKDDDSIEELIALLAELDAPSGGSSGVSTTHVNVEFEEDNNYMTISLDKTWQELSDLASRSIIMCSARNEYGTGIAFAGYIKNVMKIGSYMPYKVDLIMVEYGGDPIMGSQVNMKGTYFSLSASAPSEYPSATTSISQ